MTLATGRGFAALVEGHELAYAPLDADFLGLMQSTEGRAALRSPAAGLRLLRRIGSTFRRFLDEAWDASRHVDAIVYHPKMLGGASVGERLGGTDLPRGPDPGLLADAHLPSPGAPGRGFGGAGDRASFGAVNRLLTLPYRGMVNGWRRETLGLPPLRSPVADGGLLGPEPTKLYPYSPLVVPRPTDWDERSHANGY